MISNRAELLEKTRTRFHPGVIAKCRITGDPIEINQDCEFYFEVVSENVMYIKVKNMKQDKIIGAVYSKIAEYTIGQFSEVLEYPVKKKPVEYSYEVAKQVLLDLDTALFGKAELSDIHKSFLLNRFRDCKLEHIVTKIDLLKKEAKDFGIELEISVNNKNK